MAAKKVPLRLGGLRPAVIRALVNASPEEQYLVRIGDLEPHIVDVLDGKGYLVVPPGPTRLSADGIAARAMLVDVAKRYGAGNSALGIARVYKVSEKTIARWLHAMDVTVRHYKVRLPEAKRREIATFYASHPKITVRGTARLFGFSTHSVRHTLRKYQVPIRNAHRYTYTD